MSTTEQLQQQPDTEPTSSNKALPNFEKTQSPPPPTSKTDREGEEIDEEGLKVILNVNVTTKVSSSPATRSSLPLPQFRDDADENEGEGEDGNGNGDGDESGLVVNEGDEEKGDSEQIEQAAPVKRGRGRPKGSGRKKRRRSSSSTSKITATAVATEEIQTPTMTRSGRGRPRGKPRGRGRPKGSGRKRRHSTASSSSLLTPSTTHENAFLTPQPKTSSSSSLSSSSRKRSRRSSIINHSHLKNLSPAKRRALQKQREEIEAWRKKESSMLERENRRLRRAVRRENMFLREKQRQQNEISRSMRKRGRKRKVKEVEDDDVEKVIEKEEEEEDIGVDIVDFGQSTPLDTPQQHLSKKDEDGDEDGNVIVSTIQHAKRVASRPTKRRKVNDNDHAAAEQETRKKGKEEEQEKENEIELNDLNEEKETPDDVVPHDAIMEDKDMELVEERKDEEEEDQEEEPPQSTPSERLQQTTSSSSPRKNHSDVSSDNDKKSSSSPRKRTEDQMQSRSSMFPRPRAPPRQADEVFLGSSYVEKPFTNPHALRETIQPNTICALTLNIDQPPTLHRLVFEKTTKERKKNKKEKKPQTVLSTEKPQIEHNHDNDGEEEEEEVIVVPHDDIVPLRSLSVARKDMNQNHILCVDAAGAHVWFCSINKQKNVSSSSSSSSSPSLNHHHYHDADEGVTVVKPIEEIDQLAPIRSASLEKEGDTTLVVNVITISGISCTFKSTMINKTKTNRMEGNTNARHESLNERVTFVETSRQDLRDQGHIIIKRETFEEGFALLTKEGIVFTAGKNRYNLGRRPGDQQKRKYDENDDDGDALKEVIFPFSSSLFPESDGKSEFITDVSFSNCHGLACSNAGNVFAWGVPEEGRLGLGIDVCGLDVIQAPQIIRSLLVKFIYFHICSRLFKFSC